MCLFQFSYVCECAFVSEDIDICLFHTISNGDKHHIFARHLVLYGFYDDNVLKPMVYKNLNAFNQNVDNFLYKPIQNGSINTITRMWCEMLDDG